MRGAIVGLLIAVGSVLGCSKNEAASAACAAAGDTTSCESCCTANGANGYKFVGAGTCGCLGGKAAAAPAPAGGGAATAFAGTYRSNWGPTVFTQTGNVVNARYPNGSMSCTASGSSLDCSWSEKGMVGKAKLIKGANGAITGTWGNGGSATDGGSWNFAP